MCSIRVSTYVWLVLFVVTAVAAGNVATAADDALWKVGLASVKITPEVPLFMSGYSSRTKPFEKDYQRLDRLPRVDRRTDLPKDQRTDGLAP
jgi:hypothetical protein